MTVGCKSLMGNFSPSISLSFHFTRKKNKPKRYTKPHHLHIQTGSDLRRILHRERIFFSTIIERTKQQPICCSCSTFLPLSERPNESHVALIIPREPGSFFSSLGKLSWTVRLFELLFPFRGVIFARSRSFFFSQWRSFCKNLLQRLDLSLMILLQLVNLLACSLGLFLCLFCPLLQEIKLNQAQTVPKEWMLLNNFLNIGLEGKKKYKPGQSQILLLLP